MNRDIKPVEQRELALPESTNVIPLHHRDIINLMEWPFFPIQKSPVREPREYNINGTTIELKPGHNGLANIYDKDMLIYCASLIAQAMNAGDPVSPTLRFNAHDFFRSCGRSSGGRAYKDLADTLDRLQSTSIRTNISRPNGERGRGFMSWIKSGRMVERQNSRGRPVLGMVEVELDDWVYRQITEDKTILAISREYFSLTSGFTRRIYEIARKHCGNQTAFSISLPLLASKVGYESEDLKGLRNFKKFLCETIEAADLPDYTIYIARMGDVSCEPVSVETVRKTRGMRGFKCVFVRADALDRRATKKVAAPITPSIDEAPETEEMAMATAEDFQRLIRQLGASKRVSDR